MSLMAGGDRLVQEWIDRFQGELLTRAQDVLPRVVTALIIFFIGLLLARLASRWLAVALDRSRIRNDPLLRNFFVRTVSLTLLVLAGISSLGHLGWDIRTFLTGLGITGIIIGFGLRDTLSNFASGLLLLIYRPFRAGEVIEVEGSQGTVQELTIVNMQMVGNDGVRIIMPNSKVWGAKIINYSLSERRRIELIIKVPDDKTNKALKTIDSALSRDERLLQDPPTSTQIISISDKAATLRVWAWTKPESHQAAAGDLYLRLSTSLAEAGIALM
jgi:small conductance mechanosensitive channel